jgi:hypothetical protein
MWVSQLKFYYKFINCRVIYLTGGTGVGKSTQIPKLLLYGLNAFDFKTDGKLINTQPRQKPTSNNAKFIAKQLGIYIDLHRPHPGSIMKQWMIKTIYDHLKNNDLI